MGLEITMLCDRKTTNVSKSQIGFIQFVVAPYFDAMTVLMPEMGYTVAQLRANKDEWARQEEEYERLRVEEGNKNI